MTCDPTHRDSSWQMIQPGCWIDPDGAPHVFPDEIVAWMRVEHPEAGFNYSREDYDMIVATVMEVFRETCGISDLRIIKHTRESEA